VARPLARALAAVSVGTLIAAGLCSCASTLQTQPIPHNDLEYMVSAAYPVYWLGASFQGMAVSETSHDPSDAWSVQYGGCLEGGESTCVPPLQIVTSPDNSFLPGNSSTTHATRIRGVQARVARGGKTIVIPTGPVIVSIFAASARVAAAAARTAVPINEAAASGGPLRAALPNTGFGQTPLPSQVPSPLEEHP
jgi:hypothetical protein